MIFNFVLFLLYLLCKNLYIVLFFFLIIEDYFLLGDFLKYDIFKDMKFCNFIEFCIEKKLKKIVNVCYLFYLKKINKELKIK